jgi:hypothetical protein
VWIWPAGTKEDLLGDVLYWSAVRVDAQVADRGTFQRFGVCCRIVGGLAPSRRVGGTLQQPQPSAWQPQDERPGHLDPSLARPEPSRKVNK